MKFIDQLNADLEDLANEYADYNAAGIPCTWPHGKPFQFTDLRKLPNIAFNEHTPVFLHHLAAILEKYV